MADCALKRQWFANMASIISTQLLRFYQSILSSVMFNLPSVNVVAYLNMLRQEKVKQYVHSCGETAVYTIFLNVIGLQYFFLI